MASDDVVQLYGAKRLNTVARRLKQAGDKDVQRELHRSLNRATKPMRATAKRRAEEILPHRGGLARRVASARMQTRLRTKGNETQVSVRATSQLSLRSIDRGRLRHPVFGNRNVWVNQPVTRGWWTDSMKKHAPDVRRELVKSLDDIHRKLNSPVSG